MLSKTQRLSRKEFTPVYKLGKRLNTSLFSVVFNKTEEKPKFSVVVSKKVSKSAIKRHKIKRWVYESIRAFLKNNPDFSYNTIFIVNPTITKTRFITLSESVYESLYKISH